ncbi:MAG TPA: helix-turn-helix domain-containing protein [bacterium]
MVRTSTAAREDRDPARLRLELGRIRRLVGPVTPEQLRFVDCFAGVSVALFVPAAGHCGYAIQPAHRHPAYSFIVNFDDHGSYSVGGRRIAGVPGTVSALSPQVPHQEHPGEQVARYIAVLVAPELFERVSRAYPRPVPRPLLGHGFPASPDLVLALKEFMRECDDRPPGAEEVLEALGVRIAHLLVRGLLGIAGASERVERRAGVDRAIHHMHVHYGEKLTVAALAGLAAMSPSHFARVFRTETGRPPLEYLLDVRLEKARQLLRGADLPVTEIALRCGFGTSSHFAATFRRRFGTTARGYRATLTRSSPATKKGRIPKDAARATA